MNYDNRKEVEEAIHAGERALASLHQAKKKLDSAGHWGLFDLLGGGLVTDLIKHSKVNEAKSCLEGAKKDLKLFRKEMSDIEGALNVQLALGDFLTFADFFFDGFIADYLVHSKIKDAKQQTETAIVKVTQIIQELKDLGN